MDLVILYGFIGLIVERATAILRTTFDTRDSWPKATWLYVAWGLGIVAAYLVCNAPASLTARLGVTLPTSCTAAVLAGVGYGSVGGFWHELLSYLSARGTSSGARKSFLSKTGP